ncbi:alpha-L-arabinofuranosidase 1-like protein isoform X1 [Cinnamomum micranthum f. kanehirae]|uniref:Alpha-L-arabinofuranosidase 1-like protein isoform X1 n=1 Tax=Cinnamomum micranthum f. kanehirae TaxID=337451 RepID=A0A443N8G5_9MAGN|nr:alpha-L-arabinofuranosidase 1-like protein isoform X1 [Cinnamomum micranthum f. kanehirae]
MDLGAVIDAARDGQVSQTALHIDVSSLRMIVNFGNASINLKISVVGLGSKQFRSVGSTKTILTSSNLKDENSYKEPNKVAPIQSTLEKAGPDMDVVLTPHSFTAFDLLLDPTILPVPVYKSSI